MRVRFSQRRRLAMPALHDNPQRDIQLRKPVKDFIVEAPPELPRLVPVGVIRKGLPWFFGLVILGMVVFMFMSGTRVATNPMYLMFMLMMVVSLVGTMNNQGNGRSEMSTSEVDSERASYLRYLSGTGKAIRETADAQRKTAQWSHQDPAVLYTAIGTQRMWERGSTDPDYLKIRVGLDSVALNARIKPKPVESEIDLEPVSKTALQHLRAVQGVIPHCPMALDLAGCSSIPIYGERDLFIAALRAWISQLVVWHTPNNAAVAVVSTQLEAQWGWAKWLPHTETQDVDGAGPARLLGGSLDELAAALEPLLARRQTVLDDKGQTDRSAVTKGNRHLLLVVDDPDASPAALRKIAALDGVTVVTYRRGEGPDRDYAAHEREHLLKAVVDAAGAGDKPMLLRWNNFRWQTYCTEPDFMDMRLARHLAMTMTRWDGAPTGRQDAESAAAQTHLSLLGIPNAANLDVNALWSPHTLPVGTGEPVNLDPLLRAPLGLKPDGSALWIDVKDEADGGNGPHGLMIGMTGSGKSKMLNAMMFGLLTRHSPEILQTILVDYKDGAGFDAYTDYPHVAAVITNMEASRSIVERFGETLEGLMDARGQAFMVAGHQIKGAAFESLNEYNRARATPEGKDLPPIPWLLIVIDEMSLLLKDHKDMAEVFDKVTRKGRSQGISFLFASQTLDHGVLKQIPDNTQYRIGLKVASSSTSRSVIGTEELYTIQDGKNFKGTAFFVRAPGAEPVRYRGFLLPDRYEPPTTTNRRVTVAQPRVRLFTAGPVARDPDTIVEEVTVAESVIEGPPRSLVQTVGPQLAAAYGKRLPQLWSAPLDEPIPLDELLAAAATAPTRSAGPWWPWGKVDRPRQLSHGPLNYSVDDGNIVLLGAETAEVSTVVQTFILSAASRYSPRDVGFYALSYGGPALATVRGLPHVGAIAGAENKELSARIFGDFDALAARRRKLFDDNDIGSISEYRQRRAAGDAALDDGYPADIFLIVDGWEGFLADNTSLFHMKNPNQKKVAALANAGRGIHVIVTGADRFIMNDVYKTAGVRYELKLADNTASQVRQRAGDKSLQRPQDRIPVGQPGRGITVTGDTVRFAVGRTDGAATMDELDTAVRQTVTDVIDRHHGARPVPRPKLLPRVIGAQDLRGAHQSREQYTIGLRGRDLQPLVIDFAREPLLAVYGDQEQGKSMLVAHLLRTIVARRSGHEEAIICLIDKSRKLVTETRQLTEGEDYYESEPAAIAARIAALDHVLQQRTPPPNLTWEQQRDWRFEGPLVYLIIDDYDAVPKQLQAHHTNGAGFTQVWQPILRHVVSARDIGLRVIMTHRAKGVAAIAHAPGVPAELLNEGANTILLGSNSKEKIAGTNFEEGLPPGRGMLVSPNEDNGGYVQLAALDEPVLQAR